MKYIKNLVVSLMTCLMFVTSTGCNVVKAEEVTDLPVTYNATFEFVASDGSELPDEVMAFLPERLYDLPIGETVEAKSIDDVLVGDYNYHFAGWNFDKAEIVDSDLIFIGTWNKEEISNKNDSETQVVEKTDEKQGEGVITISYAFYEAWNYVTPGRLPEEVMKLLPESYEESTSKEHVPVDLEITQVGDFHFDGWNRYINPDTGDITYQGIWSAPDSAWDPSTRRRGLTFAYSGYWDVPNSIGYTGASALSLSGMRVFCVDSHTPLDNTYNGTNYEASGSIGGKIAAILVMGTYNGVDIGSMQAAIWNYQRGTSAGGADCQPGYWAYDDDGWDVPSVTVYTSPGKQDLAGDIGRPTPKVGYLRVCKSSTNGTITNGNGMYSLAGATYNVYYGSSHVATLSTGSDGCSGWWETRDFGTYTVREANAPASYYADGSGRSVDVSAGGYSTAYSYETPKLDPSGITIYKYNERTGRVYNYDQYLDEAQFTVRYYDADIADVSGRSPKYSLTFKARFETLTDGRVQAIVLFDRAHLVGTASNDYFDSNGAMLMPLGTITIQETLAPTGFAADPNLYYGHVRLENGNAKFRLDGTGSSWLDIDNLDMTQREEQQTITINIQKKDKETGLAQPQGLEDLSGAKFEVRYFDPVTNQKYLVGTLTTDSQGKASISKDLVGDFDGEDLITGKYYITEIAAPDGYQIEPGEIVLDVAPDNYKVNPSEVEFNAPPLEVNTAHFTYSYDHSDTYIRGGFTLTKYDSDFIENRPQGDATNLITEYEVISLNTKNKVVDANLDGVEDKTSEVCSYGEVCFTFKTDTNGNYTSKEHLLPKGKWRIRESKSPTGYLVEGNTVSRDFEITYDGQVIDLNDTDYNDLLTDDVIRGHVEIAKRDFESKQNTPLGGAEVDGAYVQLINRSENPITVYTAEGMIEVPVGAVVPTEDGVRTVEVNKLTHETKQYTAITAENENGEHGRITFSEEYLPYGTYDYVEILPPTGYLSLGNATRENLVGTFSIRNDKVLVRKITVEEEALVNSVLRGDFEIRKIDADTQDYMGGVEFSIESVTTGEIHYFTTDANGYYSSATSWNPHSYDTNGGNDDSGMWFGNYVADGEIEYNNTVAVNDNLGALPYDMYFIKELRGPNNFGKKMWQGYIQVNRDNQLVPVNNVENVSIKLKTTATNDMENSPVPKLIPALEDTKIIDTVDYENMQPGQEYKLVTILMNKETGQPVVDLDGNDITGEKVFTPSAGSGTVTTEMIFNMENLEEGMEVVVFEFLYEGDELAAQHANLEDAGQTVRIPGVKTTALDSETNGHVGQLGKVKLIDTVQYTAVQANKDYTIMGTLIDKETGDPVLDKEGNPVIAEKTFRARQKDGTVELEFDFEVEDYGHSYVVFEELIHDQVEYAVHHVLEDEEESIHFPRLRTLIRTENFLQNVIGEGTHRITDAIYYENVSPLHTYTVKGALMDSETGEIIKDKQGNEFVAETTFEPTSNSGVTEVEFLVNIDDLAGHKLVAFETLDFEGFDVSTDADLANQGETIWVPNLKTLAHADDKDENGEFFRTVIMDEAAVIIDEIEYDHLQAGHDYTVRAKLVDKETGEFLKDIHGYDITVIKEFTAEEEEGKIEVEFTIDTRELGEHYLVAFETLYEGDVKIAKHEDIDDEDQTIQVVKPEISTVAESQNSKKEDDLVEWDTKTAAYGTITITDTVEYKNLKKDREYELTGKLMDKDGNPLLDREGEEITAHSTFTPTGRNGKEYMDFTFDFVDIDIPETVVFEKLFANAYELAIHEDLEDEDQCIKFVKPEIHTNAVDEKGEKATVKDHHVNIIDTVSYERLNVNNSYELEGRLFNKDTGEFVKDEFGFEVVAYTYFEPESSSGTVEVEFDFDASKLAYTDHLVVFEKLFLWDVEVASHEDENDEDQMIEFLIPEISTTVVDSNTALISRKEKGMKETSISVAEKLAVLDSQMKVTDTVSYKYLDDEETYTLRGILVDKKTGNPIEVTEPVNDIVGTYDGMDIIYEGDDPEAKALIESMKDYFAAANYHVVINNDHTGVISTHFNPDKKAEYEAQGWVVSDSSTVFNYDLINKLINVGGQTLKYKVVGNKLYLGEGTTWYVTTKTAEGSQPAKKEKGNIIGEVHFKPEEGKDSGTVDMVFEFNGSYLALQDYDVIVFEDLDLEYSYLKPIVDDEGEPVVDEQGDAVWEEIFVDEDIAEHKDLNDLSQWFHIWYEKPTMKTTAKFSDGEKSHLAGDKAVIVDRVEYTGLDINLEYTLRGIVVGQSDGKPVSEAVEMKFKPTTRDGVVEMKLTVDSANLGNFGAVVGEELYRTRDNLQIAVHKDLKDKDQTVAFYVPKKPVNTGSGMAAIIAAGTLVVAGTILAIINRKKKSEE